MIIKKATLFFKRRKFSENLKNCRDLIDKLERELKKIMVGFNFKHLPHVLHSEN